MDFPIDPPTLKSLTSLFFGKKDKKQSMQGPPPPPLEPGLKTLATPVNHNRSLSCKKPNILSFSSTSSSSSSLSSLSSPPSPSPSSSTMMDDVKDHNEEKEEAVVPCHAAIGNPNTNAHGSGNHNERKDEEDEEKEEEEEDKPRVAPQQQVHFRRRRSFHEGREYPPPIPHLARTGNLPCHMPWVLKRSYTDNGRLVIQEVKVKHHEYFRAHRANGRLTLQIMQLDDSATSLPSRPASPNDSTQIADKTDENSPSSSASPSPPSSPSAAEEYECNNAKINAAVERPTVPPMSPSSLPPPPSMLSKELKNIVDVNRGSASQANSSNRDDKNMRDATEMGTLPSILSSSMPESSFGVGGGNGGGGGGGCCLNKRSTSLFSTPIPTIRPVHS